MFVPFPHLYAPISYIPVQMTKTHGLLFRAYVPRLVGCLEDADSAVRDTAKMTVVELFQYVISAVFFSFFLIV